jgi:hypothetical protein
VALGHTSEHTYSHILQKATGRGLGGKWEQESCIGSTVAIIASCLRVLNGTGEFQNKMLAEQQGDTDV